jgi:transposase
MSRKKRAVPIRQHYSRDLKRRVIYQAYTLKKTSTEIAIDLDMPLRVVQRVKKTWREIGDVCRDRKYIGRSPMMSPAETKVWVFPLFHHCPLISMKFMLALIDHTPDIYLDEIQEQLFLQHDLDVSLSTISRTMKRLGLSSKKVHLIDQCMRAVFHLVSV